MNTLRQAIAEYLALRRSLGFKMNHAARELADFAAFVTDRHIGAN
jgi:integrase/recombinase XerD